MKRMIPLASVLLMSWGAYQIACAAGAVGAEERLYVVTHVDVMPRFTEAGRDLLRQFAVDSRKDAGAVRIEVFEELSRPNHSTVVEVWEGRKAYDDHLEAAPLGAIGPSSSQCSAAPSTRGSTA
jgi:quinol monooxygenase YgiN